MTWISVYPVVTKATTTLSGLVSVLRFAVRTLKRFRFFLWTIGPVTVYSFFRYFPIGGRAVNLSISRDFQRKPRCLSC